MDPLNSYVVTFLGGMVLMAILILAFQPPEYRL
jgi:hypothetical protein